jgi:hypothetical protein
MTPTATRKLWQTAKEVLSGLSARPTAHRGDCRDRARAPLGADTDHIGSQKSKGRPGRRPQIAKVREAAAALAGRASLRAGGYGLA